MSETDTTTPVEQLKTEAQLTAPDGFPPIRQAVDLDPIEQEPLGEGLDKLVARGKGTRSVMTQRAGAYLILQTLAVSEPQMRMWARGKDPAALISAAVYAYRAAGVPEVLRSSGS